MVVGPHEPARIFGGNCALIQHMIALGHWSNGTPSGGPHSVAGLVILFSLDRASWVHSSVIFTHSISLSQVA